MSSGAKQGLKISPETVAGTTPTPYNRQDLRHTSCTIDGQISGTESEEIRDILMSSGEYKTSATYGGEIAGELSYGTYDMLLAGAFHNDWVANKLTLGSLVKTFSILREYKDSGGYHNFKGMEVTALTIEVPEEGMVKVTFTLQGRGRDPVTFTLPAGTVTPATVTDLFTNVGIGDITIDGQSMQDIACITAVTLTMEFSAEAQKCLGKGLSVGKLITTGVAITGSATLAWGDEAASVNELKFTDSTIALVVPMSDSAGNQYILTVPEATVKGELPSGSRTDLLQYQLEFTARNISPTLERKAAPAGP